MLPIDLGRVALEQADQAEQLVDFVQMVHPVVVLHHAAQVAGALADQTVVGPSPNSSPVTARPAELGPSALVRSRCRSSSSSAPRLPSRAPATGAGRDRLREALVEPRGAGSVETVQGSQRASPLTHFAAAVDDVDHREQRLHRRGDHPVPIGPRNSLKPVTASATGALVRRAHGGDRGHQLRRHPGDVSARSCRPWLWPIRLTFSAPVRPGPPPPAPVVVRRAPSLLFTGDCEVAKTSRAVLPGPAR